MRLRSRRVRGRGGFTLLEMLIVAAMLVAVFIAVFSFVNRTAVMLRDVTLLVRQGREGPAILSQIERDLANAYADARMEDMFECSDSGGGTELRFVTSRNSIMYLDGAQSDLTETGYRVKRNRDGNMTLYRREEFLLDDLPLEGGKWIPIANNVVEFKCWVYDMPVEGADGEEISLDTFRLLDGTIEELESWDKEDRYLPYAVKILLRLDTREGSEMSDQRTAAEGIQTFTSIVRLPPFPRNLDKREDRVDLRLNTPTAAPNTNTNTNNTNNNTNNNANNNANNNNNNNANR